MNKKARNATLIGLAAGLVLIPVLRAVIRRSRRKTEEPLYEGAPPNHIFAAYRGKHKPHKRKKGDGGAH